MIIPPDVAALIETVAAGSPQERRRALEYLTAFLVRDGQPRQYDPQLFRLPAHLEALHLRPKQHRAIVERLIAMIEAHPADALNVSIIAAVSQSFPSAATGPLLTLLYQFGARLDADTIHSAVSAFDDLLYTPGGRYPQATARLLHQYDLVPSLQEWAFSSDDRLAKTASQRLESFLRWLPRVRTDDVASLLRLLADPQTAVRLEAIRDIERAQAKQAVPHLVELLHDGDEGVRAAAARALWLLADRSASAALVDALRDPAGRVRMAAAWALERLRPPRALEPLLETLHDAEYPVRRAAAKALGALGRLEIVQPLLQAVRDARLPSDGSANDALVSAGKAAVPALIAALKDESLAVRECAAQALVLIRDPRAVEPIREILPTLPKESVDHFEFALSFMFSD